MNSQAATIQVQVGSGGLKFTPQNVTIQVGDTVQWTWASSNHSSTSGTPGNPDGLWDSGVINSGTFSHTFSSAGTFAYFCSPHGSCCGMIGSVMVTAPSDTVTITRAQYTSTRSQLTVNATDTNSSAVLTVSITSSGMVLGPLRGDASGSYSGKFTVATNPVNITVTSSLGGSASAPVRGR